ncbi:MAG: DUF1624 domain-containing protein [Christensenellaceae bacterium]|jgi:uncharacterized membrane protein|nr:DUF1624 domain-containing protein [Christensenellaceae bacterium]
MEALLKEPKKRVWEVDFLRGFAILLVVLDHAMVDLGDIFYGAWVSSDIAGLVNAAESASNYLVSDIRTIWHPIFVFIFFFVSGLSCALSKNNFVRGFKLLIVAQIVTVATAAVSAIIEFDLTISFGVLHALAISIIIFSAVDFVATKFSKTKQERTIFYLALSVFIFVLSTGIFARTGIDYTKMLSYGGKMLDKGVFEGVFVYTKAMGRVSPGDYFPLLPHLGWFAIGAALSAVLYPDKKSLLPKLDGKWHYPLTITGRFTLLIYIGEQVVLALLLALITYAVTGTFF